MPSPTQHKQTTPSKPTTPPTKQEATPKTEPEAAPKTKPEETVEETVDWDALPKATDNIGDVRAVRIDVKKEIPASIQADVEEAFKKYTAAVAAAKEGQRVSPPKLSKELPTAELALKYTELIKRYGKYRPEGQLTVRGGPVATKPTLVLFSAKTYEERKPKGDTGVTKK